MGRRFADIAFTPSVRKLRERYGSRLQYARMQTSNQTPDQLGRDETAFLEQADNFYLATVSETGWPYVQHRGGPQGFVRVLSPERIAFADFRGNLQYVSAGNTAGNDRVALIFMDYVQRQRLKLLGQLHFVELNDADEALVRQVALPLYRAKVERVAVIDVVAFDWNCPQHITQRFTLTQVDEIAQPLRDRIARLEEQLREARAKSGDPSC